MHTARAQVLRDWGAADEPGARYTYQPRDGTLLAVSAALGVCPSTFHRPIPD